MLDIFGIICAIIPTTQKAKFFMSVSLLTLNKFAGNYEFSDIY